MDEKRSLPGTLSQGDDEGVASKDLSFWSGTRSVDISASTKSADGVLHVTSTGPNKGFFSFFSLENVNILMTVFRIYTILERETRALLKRPKMILSSVLLQLLIAGMVISYCHVLSLISAPHD